MKKKMNTIPQNLEIIAGHIHGLAQFEDGMRVYHRQFDPVHGSPIVRKDYGYVKGKIEKFGETLIKVYFPLAKETLEFKAYELITDEVAVN